MKQLFFTMFTIQMMLISPAVLWAKTAVVYIGLLPEGYQESAPTLKRLVEEALQRKYTLLPSNKLFATSPQEILQTFRTKKPDFLFEIRLLRVNKHLRLVLEEWDGQTQKSHGVARIRLIHINDTPEASKILVKKLLRMTKRRRTRTVYWGFGIGIFSGVGIGLDSRPNQSGYQAGPVYGGSLRVYMEIEAMIRIDFEASLSLGERFEFQNWASVRAFYLFRKGRVVPYAGAGFNIAHMTRDYDVILGNKTLPSDISATVDHFFSFSLHAGLAFFFFHRTHMTLELALHLPMYSQPNHLDTSAQIWTPLAFLKLNFFFF